MADKIRAAAISLGLLVSVLLLELTWQRSFAQAPGEAIPIEQEPLHVVTIPTTGYKPQPKSQASEKGRKLFADLNCMACHTIHNVGGDLAPMLDGVGGRRADLFLMAHLSNSMEAQQEYKLIRGMDYASALSHSRYSPETARLLVAYLGTLPEPAGGFVVMPHTPRKPVESSPVMNKDFRPAAKTSATVEGGKLYDKFGCVACHAIGEVGGWVGPRLDGVGGRHGQEYIKAHVTDAQAHARELSTQSKKVVAKMPRLKISPEQAQSITDYLMTLPRLETEAKSAQ